ncbi:MAG TPA: D-2-hydroxyacid dehydrogenase [Terriglobales bacterium]|nr:D-2-hydroxyacid dehydrogenase [Terriglobales bacterium]
MKVLIVLHHQFELWNAPAWLADRLRRDFHKLDITQRDDYEGIEDYLRDAEIVITWSLRPEQFRAARKLRWIHSTAAAIHQLLFPELVESDVILTNAREVHGPVGAEHALALIFALTKRLPAAIRFQSQHVWGQGLVWRDSQPTWEVQDSTLGIIGLGSIGRELATRAAALGMRVVAVREHPEKGMAGVNAVYGPDQLDEVLAASNYVVLAAPITPKTRSLLTAERLTKMRSDAYLINVSRGPLVDEAALITALQKKQIAGAALDVFVEEPLPAGSPLWDMENVLITPHTAGITEKLWERQYALIHDNLRRFLAGEPLRGVVDKSMGY